MAANRLLGQGMPFVLSRVRHWSWILIPRLVSSALLSTVELVEAESRRQIIRPRPGLGDLILRLPARCGEGERFPPPRMRLLPRALLGARLPNPRKGVLGRPLPVDWSLAAASCLLLNAAHDGSSASHTGPCSLILSFCCSASLISGLRWLWRNRSKPLRRFMRPEAGLKWFWLTQCMAGSLSRMVMSPLLSISLKPCTSTTMSFLSDTSYDQ
mmetsp:Transcript_35291/g.89321  ORF Transcript_35291/g.89321 Transcript_35291/m.89321 type:complete len:213 (-) Transcript_35291:1549-2187(-)